ncbi:hypothetical protein ACMFMF_000789 [Clarireedia jacksonii]
MVMVLCDIQNRVFRDKLKELQTDYPSTPLLFLVYTLLKNGQDVQCARNYLRDNKWVDGNVTSISATSLQAIQSTDLRKKVWNITQSLRATVWWTAYALRVCNGSVNEASGLLTEGVIDATINPWESAMNLNTDDEIFASSTKVKVSTPKIKAEPNASASPALGGWSTPPVSPDTSNDTGGMKEGLPFLFKNKSRDKAGTVIDGSSEDEDENIPDFKNEGRGRNMFRHTAEISDTEEDKREDKIKQIREIFPHLTSLQCRTSLELSDGDVSEAISLEMENLREERAVDREFQIHFSNSSSPAQKRKSSTPDDRLRKKLCVQDDEDDASVLPEAGQWVKSMFKHFISMVVTINLKDGQTREIPQGLLIEHSSYFRQRLEGNSKQPAVTEMDLKDVNCILFDLIIQYMVCRNISFGDVPTLSTMFISIIMDLLVLSARLEVHGMSTILLALLEDTIKKARKNATTSSILKAVHIHRAYSDFEKHHPVRKLFVKACVRPYMEAGIADDILGSAPSSDSSSDDSGSDDEGEKIHTAIDIDVISRQQGHLACKFNRAFKIDLIFAADRTRRNRVSRPKNVHGKGYKNVVTWYTDPLDSQQFTI